MSPTTATRIPSTVALAGAAVVVVGCFLTWYTTFAGLHVARGADLTSGRVTLGLVVLLVAAASARLATPRRVPALVVLVCAGAVAAAGAYLAAAMVAALQAFRGDPFLFGRGGPGVWVVAAGAALAVAAAVVDVSRSAARPAATTDVAVGYRWSRSLVAGSLAAAGLVHLAITPEHLHEWVWYGVFFVALAGGQLAGAGLALYRPSRRLWVAVAAGSVSVVVLWLVTRTTGLPFGPDRAAPEAVGYADVFASAAEVLAALCAVLLLAPAASAGRHSRTARRPLALRHAGALLSVGYAAATLLAVLDGAGAFSTGVHLH